MTGAVVTLGGLAILAAAGAVALSYRSDLPDPVAVHWGLRGEPDGFWSLSALVGFMLGLGTALILAFGATTWALGRSSVSRRIGAATTVWMALYISIILLGTLDIQRGLADARDAGGVGGILLVAFLGPLAPAVIVAIVVPGDPRQPTTDAVAGDAPRASLADGDHTSWVGRVSTPVGLLVGLPVVAFTVVVVVLTQLWAVLVIGAVVMAALVPLSSFVVRVDREGLTIRSLGGWPRYRVPLDEIVRADVTQVSPLREFGGLGWRVGRDGRIGVVLRKGEGLLVQRTGGRSIVVTVDGALSAAALLNALADSARGPGQPG